MAIWFSDNPTPLPILGMGNGTISAWLEGATLYSLRAGYSMPHMCSIAPDFGGAYHELETMKTADGKGFCHRLYYSSTVLGMNTRSMCDLQIHDLQPQGMNVWLRRFEGITSLNWRMSIPSYVRCVFHPSYRFGKYRADTLFLTVPAGTPFENGMATLKEQTAAMIFCGSLRYDPIDHTIRYGGDLAELQFLFYEEDRDLIHTADALIESFSHYGEMPTLHPIYGEALGGRGEEAEPLSPCLPILAMQAEEGGVIASQREPYALATDLPVLTEVLLRSNQPESALRMLQYWTAAQERIGFVPSRLLCNAESVCEYGQVDYSATASYLLAATRLFSVKELKDEEGTALFRGMRAAFSALMQGFREGMLPFGPRTVAFDAGILGRELLFQGSAEVTALGIRAATEFLAFCDQTGKRPAKDAKGYRTILAEAAKDYEKNFTYRGKICRNAPRLETLMRRPRFIRGVCTLCQRDGAYPLEDHLELDKYGRYLCRKCFATRRGTAEETDPAKRYPAPRAVLMAALLLGTPAAMEEVPLLALSYAERICDSNALLPMREADTDPLLLLTLQHRREELVAALQKNESLRATLAKKSVGLGLTLAVEDPAAIVEYLIGQVREILDEESEEHTLSALLYDTAPLGARCAAGATALYLLATT